MDVPEPEFQALVSQPSPLLIVNRRPAECQTLGGDHTDSKLGRQGQDSVFLVICLVCHTDVS